MHLSWGSSCDTTETKKPYSAGLQGLWGATGCPACCSYPVGAGLWGDTAAVGLEKQVCRVTVMRIPRSTPLTGTATNTTTGMPCTSHELMLQYSVGLYDWIPSFLHIREICFLPLRASPVCKPYLSRENSSFYWDAS